MKILRIGTRGSRLALIQADMVAAGIRRAHPALEVEVVQIRTSGDWKPEQGEARLPEVSGGKGLFAREIELALERDEIDCGVHSLKDMPSFLPDGLVIDHILPREDARDAFLANDHQSLRDLPEGATLGTSSLRRQAFMLAKRPDLNIATFRGNVPTRIEKLRAGQVDATLLAVAGLKRLGLMGETACVLDPEEMLPAAGQGAIGIETRVGDFGTRMLLDALHDPEAGICVQAERAALQVLNGSCHTPIGAYATLQGNMLSLHVAVASPDGTLFFDTRESATASNDDEARDLGRLVGQDLKDRVPPHLLV